MVKTHALIRIPWLKVVNLRRSNGALRFSAQLRLRIFILGGVPMKKTRRIISIVLSALILTSVVTIAPYSVSAAETEIAVSADQTEENSYEQPEDSTEKSAEKTSVKDNESETTIVSNDEENTTLSNNCIPHQAFHSTYCCYHGHRNKSNSCH